MRKYTLDEEKEVAIELGMWVPGDDDFIETIVEEGYYEELMEACKKRYGERNE
jgi:hypothetical protein